MDLLWFCDFTTVNSCPICKLCRQTKSVHYHIKYSDACTALDIKTNIGVYLLPQYTTCSGGRTVQQSSQPMQFSPWQFAGTSLPQGITWATAAPGGIQSPAALLTAPNPIFIRGQQDGTGMFIQSPPPQIQSHNRTCSLDSHTSFIRTSSLYVGV